MKKLYKITADYYKREKHPTYIRWAENKKEAKEIFEKTYTWLDVYDVEEMDNDDINIARTNVIDFLMHRDDEFFESLGVEL